MLMIRLQRVGRVHEPTFRLVLTDSKNGPKSGKYLEVLGSYDPRRENKLEQFDTDKIKYWISKGAKLSDTVHNYLVSKKVIAGKKINALPKKRPIVKEKTEEEKKAEAAKAEVKVETPSFLTYNKGEEAELSTFKAYVAEVAPIP